MTAKPDAPLPALGELARLATVLIEARQEQCAALASLDTTASDLDRAARCTVQATANFRDFATPESILQLVALATGGAEDTARRNQRIVDLVCAQGSRVQPSQINPGMVVVIDGRDGLDACQRSASDCFDVLFEEQDGGTPQPRLYITVVAAHSLTPERPADA